MPHTPAELACLRAFRVLVEDQGIEAASDLLTAIGDEHSLFREPEPAKDLQSLAAQHLSAGMLKVPCKQRGAFLEMLEAQLAECRGVVSGRRAA